MFANIIIKETYFEVEILLAIGHWERMGVVTIPLVGTPLKPLPFLSCGVLHHKFMIMREIRKGQEGK